MLACRAAVDAVFMLHADKIVAIEVEEIRSPHVGSAIFLFEFEAHLRGVIVA